MSPATIRKGIREVQEQFPGLAEAAVGGRVRRPGDGRRRPFLTQAVDRGAAPGESDGVRCRLWKVCLQRLADRLGLRITVCHLPPGTSKWNKIEHRMFCHITENWRGRPLVSHAVIVELTGHTRTAGGLRIEAGLDGNRSAAGVVVSEEEFAALRLARHVFHGEWNYTISPSASPA